jgi:hypothetical protein
MLPILIGTTVLNSVPAHPLVCIHFLSFLFRSHQIRSSALYRIRRSQNQPSRARQVSVPG